ncbi:MAG: ABC-2 family transporter protein [Dehalococcoidales bacterium]|jgi:ABC-2 type transport system permease protein
MKSLARLYVQQFKATMATMFQYRASLFIWMIGQVLEPLVYLVVWSVVSQNSGGSVGGYTTGEFAAYFVLLMLVNQATYTWIMYEFEYRVREGVLSAALLRPVHPIHSDIADNLSSKLLTLPVMLAVAGALGLAFHASFVLHAWAVALFLPVLLLAFLIRFILEWTLALAAFWTTRVSAINQTYFVLMLFLSGQLVPLSLLPHPLQIAAQVLPFRWMLGFPVELAMGRLDLQQALTGIAVQFTWLAGSVILVRIVWRAGIKVYSAVGA